MSHHKHRAHARPRAIDMVAADLSDTVGEPMAQLDERQMATVVSVVYVTAAPTFSGPVGGYTTLGPALGDPVSAPSATDQAASASAESTVAKDTLSPESSASPTASAATSVLTSAAVSSMSVSSALPSSTISPSSTLSDSAALTSSSLEPTSTGDSAQSSALAASATSSTASPTATSSSSSHGMSGGAKAGLAIGLILGIGLVLGLILFCFRRKKQQQQASYAKTDDEKSSYSKSNNHRPGYAPSARSTTAPRLSLRPVTQFSPNLGGDRRSAGNALAVASAATAATSEFSQPRKPVQQPAGTVGDHMAAQDHTNDPQNPFGNHATEPQNTQNPFGNHAETLDPTFQADHQELDGLPLAEAPISSLPSGNEHVGLEGAAEATAAGLAATGAATVVEDRRHLSGPTNDAEELRPASPTLPIEAAPPSPVGTEFSVTSEVPATPTTQAAAINPGASTTNVHRVQLDFKPSMEDELELRAGQLVRLLHEYDDGWALCIRLDRSQQGVAPRTCLSSRPVRPRPNGPPPGRPNGPPPAGMRSPPRGPPMGPMGPMGPPRGPPRPMSPAGGRNSPGPFGGPGRPMSPASGRHQPGMHSQQPRPMSPASMRSPSGNFGGSPRPMSPAGGRQSPAPYARQQRSMSPGPYVGQPRPMPPAGRPRSNSAGLGNARRNSPPGPTKMNPNFAPSQQTPSQMMVAAPPQNEQAQAPNRKPLPGQAI